MSQRNDIEDVLSSIRRLVADEIEFLPRQQMAQAETAEAPRPALVLDAARRVVEPENPFRAVAAPAEAPEPRPAPAPAPVRPQAEAPTPRRTPGMEPNLIAALREEWLRGPLAPVAEPDATPEPDLPEPVDAAPAPQPDPNEPEDAAIAAPDPSEPIQVDAVPEAAPEDSGAAPEAETEPETAAVEAETVETEAPAKSADPVDLSNLSGALEDDEALRDLIAEIVRQELAGALGERITRNVRKLVRRELRQMMSSEEFD